MTDIVNVYLREHAPHVANPSFIAATAEPIIVWWADKTLADIRGKSCRDYVAWRTGQVIKRRKIEVRVSTETARHDLKTLRAAIRYFHREYGPLDAVPAITLPDKSAAKERWLTWQEARRLLAACECEHLRRFILLGLHTGTRSDATLRLRWLQSTHSGHVDLSGGMLYRAGAGERRTKKQRPACEIPARLRRHLVQWQATDAAVGQSYVIHFGQKPVDRIAKTWRTTCTRAGLGRDVTPHTLRHTCVTWLLRAGRDPWEVAGFVGMTIDTLDRTYGHHSPRLRSRARR